MSVSPTSMGTHNFVTNFYNSTVVNESLRQEKITICKDAISAFHAEKSIATVANLIGRVLLLAAYHIPIVSLIVHAAATFFDYDTAKPQLASPAGQPTNIAEDRPIQAGELVAPTMEQEAAITIQCAVRCKQAKALRHLAIMALDGTRVALTLPESTTIGDVAKSFANAAGDSNSRFSLFFGGEEEKLDEGITLKNFIEINSPSAINLKFFALKEPTDKEVLLNLIAPGGAWSDEIQQWPTQAPESSHTHRLTWTADHSNNPNSIGWLGALFNSEGYLIQLYIGDGSGTERGPADSLKGTIPPELGLFRHLEDLRLPGNELEGSIPAELGQLASLKRLSIASNRLSGPIPPELGQLSNLKILDLVGNKLTGPIPAELGQLKKLQDLSLSNNQLEGPIPAELEARRRAGLLHSNI